jgi:hypothetical protein
MTVKDVPEETRADEQIEILSLEEERAIATIRDLVSEVATTGGVARNDSIERVLSKIGVKMEFGGEPSGRGIVLLNGARFAIRIDVPLGNQLEIRFEPCST